MQDLDRAREQYLLALESVPDFLPSLDAYTRCLELAGDWVGVAKTLKAAATASHDHNETVSLYYRAARVLADKTDQVSLAVQCLNRCLELSPGFLPGVLLLKELASRQGHWGEYARLERAQADMGEDLERRHWRLIAAAETNGRLPDMEPEELAAEVLKENPAHPSALDLAERVALSRGRSPALIELYLRLAGNSEDDAQRAALCTRVAELAAELSDSETLLRGLGEVVAAAGVSGRPLHALARLAEQAGFPDEALRALAEAGDGPSIDAARIWKDSIGDADAAARELAALLKAAPSPLAAAWLASVATDPLELAGAHQLLGQHSQGRRRELHAGVAARLFDALRVLDASGAARILVAPVPKSGLGEAINDRLVRAAAPRDL